MKNNQASRQLLRFIGSMSDPEQDNLMQAIEQSDKDLKDIITIQLANKLETIGDWKHAAEQWGSIGRSQDAEMCKSIHKTIQERRKNENNN